MPSTLYTVGHWYFHRQQLLALLKEHQVDVLVDVRRYPGSRSNPDVSKDAMEIWLPESGIAYYHDIRLGGRRGKGDTVDTDNWWKVTGFRNYAAYTRSHEFGAAYQELLAVADYGRTAIMCGEPHHSRCHRRIISDLAVLDGHNVIHIGPDGLPETHIASDWAAMIGSDPPHQCR